MKKDTNMKESFALAGSGKVKASFPIGLRLARQTIFIAWLSAALTLASGTSHAQNQNQPQAKNEKSQIALNMQDVDIRVLINTVAEVSGKNFIVDPRVKGKISVISGTPLHPDDLFSLFLSILEVHNFATVETGNVIKVLPSNVIKQRPTPTLFSPGEDSNDEQITQIIQLNHAPVQDLVPIIRPLIPPTSHFAPHQPSNSVVITDTAANIQRVLQIIRKIDIPDKRASIHLVNLEYALASDLAATLTQLVTATADPQAAAGSTPKVNIQAYDSTNSLLISAAEEQFVRIQALIDELDVEREASTGVTVIPLKHSNAMDLAGILRDLNANAGQDGALASELLVQADEASNSLIVKATGAQLQSVQSVVEQLDKRRAQVFVETIIAEVSLDQVAELGITLDGGLDAPLVGGTAADGTTAAVAGTPDPRANTVGSRAGTGVSSTVFDLGTAGFNYSLLGFGRFELDVIINALRQDTDTNILSTPTILTLDNEEAEITVGQEVPFLTGSFTNGLNDSTTDGAGNTVATGSAFNTIERRDVGIVLRIRPQISEGDTIQLEVFQENSSVAPTPVGTFSDVVTNRSTLEAVVQVDDGQVIALGGLTQEDQSDVTQWVPFLGKLPLIGSFFRNKSKTANKQNLMVFLKPRIIRTPADLAKISKERYDEVRRDSIIQRNSTDGLLLENSEPPVLVKYEETLDDGRIISEARLKRELEGEPKRGIRPRIKDIIFGRKPLDRQLRERDDQEAKEEAEFRTDGALEETKTEVDESEAALEVLDISSGSDKANQEQHPTGIDLNTVDE